MRTYHINLNRTDFENIESDGELIIFLDDGNKLSLEFEKDDQEVDYEQYASIV